MTNKDNTFRVVAIVGLIMGVAALTIGFAAFTQTLTISSSAEVKNATEALDIAFSNSGSAKAASYPVTITPTTTGTGTTANAASLNTTTISGLKAIFTGPGQTATYSFYVYNNSPYTAYLTGITYAAVSGSDTIVCTAKSGTTQSYVDTACNGITVTVTIGDSGSQVTATGSRARAEVNSHTLAATTGEPVTVTISYTEPTSYVKPDGDFDVAIGNITLDYSTVA